jgi:hypothetical protein
VALDNNSAYDIVSTNRATNYSTGAQCQQTPRTASTHRGSAIRQIGEPALFHIINSVTLVGFVGSDPEQRQAKGNGSKFTVLSVATQRSWKNADDEWSSKTEWHRIVLIWN